MSVGLGALARNACLCPTLSEAMIARAAPFGVIERVCKGTRLPAAEPQLEDFFVLLEGAITYRTRHDETQVRFATTERGQFSGELSLLSRGVGSMVGCVVVDSSVLRVPRDRFRKLLAAETDIAELILRAFIYRRLAASDENLHPTVDGLPGRRPGLHLALTIAANGAILALGCVPGVGWIDTVSQLVAG